MTTTLATASTAATIEAAEATSAEQIEAAPGQPVVRDMDRFSGHPVRLSMFIGPLDLLLYLVRAHRYDICDIPIAPVAREYGEWLRLFESAQSDNLDNTGEFLITAATLMQIKSRALLPKQESANEDAMQGESGRDPKRELVQKLLEYERFQAAAHGLHLKREERALQFGRPTPLDQTLRDLEASAEDQARAEALLLANVSSFDLLRALQRVLDRKAPAPVATIRREPFTLAERTRAVWAMLKDGEVSFGALCEDCESRLEVVITFLSILELIRRGRLEVRQEAAFEEIFLAPSADAPAAMPHMVAAA
jgi:segregation and condensation protein A